MNRNRIAKLAKRVEILTRPSASVAAAERLDQEFRAVLHRVLCAIPAERAERVAEALRAYVERQSDPDTPRPALLEWIDENAFPHPAWFPDPIPLALVDALLDHPEAEMFYACLHCGLAVPNLPPSGTVWEGTFKDRVQLFDACPHCGGPIHWYGSCEQKCHRLLPNLGAELLAGRDPCKTIPPDNPNRIWDGDGRPLPGRGGRLY